MIFSILFTYYFWFYLLYVFSIGFEIADAENGGHT